MNVQPQYVAGGGAGITAPAVQQHEHHHEPMAVDGFETTGNSSLTSISVSNVPVPGAPISNGIDPQLLQTLISNNGNGESDAGLLQTVAAHSQNGNIGTNPNISTILPSHPPHLAQHTALPLATSIYPSFQTSFGNTQLQVSHLPIHGQDVHQGQQIQQLQAQPQQLQQHVQQQLPQQQNQQMIHEHQQLVHNMLIDPSVTHNLIPGHLQSTSQAASMNGTPGYQPALILPNMVNANINANTFFGATAPIVAPQQQHPQAVTTAAMTSVIAAATTNSVNGHSNMAGPLPHTQLVPSPSMSIPLPLPTIATHMAVPTPAMNISHNPLLSDLSVTTATSSASRAIPTIPISLPLTVQDRNVSIFPPPTPVYQGINTNYVTESGKRPLKIHSNPPMYLVEDFLTPYECQFLVLSADGSFTPAPVVGKGAGEISASRTSTTCYLAREDLPDYLRKVSALTAKPIDHCELPQVGRYLPSQQYLYHFDAFDLSNEDGIRFASNGGQRVVTVLVYLNDCEHGGETHFPNCSDLKVKPRQGTAVVFFPSTVDGYLDKNALHAALPAIDTKFVSQVWIRQSNYNGTPSKRLQQTLGVPF